MDAQQFTNRRQLARSLKGASSTGWMTYDRSAEIDAIAWIDRMVAAQVSSGRDVAIAIANERTTEIDAARGAAYDRGGMSARQYDAMFQIFAAA